ncbi:hypothetical protein [Marinomonas epiphytica]
MKTLIIPLSAFLVACSSSELRVVDNLTVSARNDGVFMNPSKWVVWGHPLQTTYVSLNGQLALESGQLCLASRYRSPFTVNCFGSVNGKSGSVHYEHYPSESTALDQLVVNQQRELNAAEHYIVAANKLLQCKAKKPANDAVCQEAQQQFNIQENTLAAIRNDIYAFFAQKNRLVYNWSQELKLENGVFISEQLTGGTNYSNNSAGATIVNGFSIERFRPKCSEFTEKGKEKYKDFKVVTSIIKAHELYYQASDNRLIALQSKFNKSLPLKEDSVKNDSLNEIIATVNANLASSQSLSSAGYLAINKKTSNALPIKGSVYYAVLTDAENLFNHCLKVMPH